jgi:hypothetical protein
LRQSRPKDVAPEAGNTCGTFAAFSSGRMARFCSVPSVLKTAKT